MGRGAARARGRGRRAPAPPPLHGRRVRVLRGKGGGGTRERSPGDGVGGRPPLRRVRTRLRVVHRGAGERLLRRPRSLRRAHRRGGGAVRQRPRLRHRLLRRRSPVVRPDRGGARARRGIDRGRTIAWQPLLDRLRALDRRDGLLQGGRAPRVRGMGRGRRLRAPAPRAVLRRLPRAATLPACTPPTERSEPRWCCSPMPSVLSSVPATCPS